MQLSIKSSLALRSKELCTQAVEREISKAGTEPVMFGSSFAVDRELTNVFV